MAFARDVARPRDHRRESLNRTIKHHLDDRDLELVTLVQSRSLERVELFVDALALRPHQWRTCESNGISRHVDDIGND